MDNNIPAGELTFEQARAELETILNTLRSDSVQVDQLVELTRRGAALVKECKKRLVLTEAELAEVLKSLE